MRIETEHGNYDIRKVLPGDGSELARLAKRGMPGYPFLSVYSEQELEDAIQKDADYRIVAENYKGEIIGTAVLGMDGVMAEIKRVVVCPAMRKNGLAKNMTTYLADYAGTVRKVPWTDTRADQIGMQRSSHKANLKSYSLEQGKHVVYEHRHASENLGAARETMVHMSALDIGEEHLYQDLSAWDHPARRKLVANMIASLIPDQKALEIADMYLPSAAQVKAEINEKLERVFLKDKLARINDDITVVNEGGMDLLVIKPDASGFVLSKPNKKLPVLLEKAEESGLQIVTYYAPTNDRDLANLLNEMGLEPAMIRPWHNMELQTPVWEAGWRKTMNQYEKCLHILKLDPAVNREVRGFLNRLIDHAL